MNTENNTQKDTAAIIEGLEKASVELEKARAAFQKTNAELFDNARKILEANPDAEVLIILAPSGAGGITPLWNFRTPASLTFALEFFKQTFFTSFLMKAPAAPAPGPRIIHPLDGQTGPQRG